MNTDELNLAAIPSLTEIISIVGLSRIIPLGNNGKKKKEFVAPVSPTAQYDETKTYRIVAVNPEDANYERRSELIGLTGKVKDVCLVLRFYADNGKSFFMFKPVLEKIGE
jgi:hypothetical protein